MTTALLLFWIAVYAGYLYLIAFEDCDGLLKKLWIVVAFVALFNCYISGNRLCKERSGRSELKAEYRP